MFGSRKTIPVVSIILYIIVAFFRQWIVGIAADNPSPADGLPDVILIRTFDFGFSGSCACIAQFTQADLVWQQRRMAFHDLAIASIALRSSTYRLISLCKRPSRSGWSKQHVTSRRQQQQHWATLFPCGDQFAAFSQKAIVAAASCYAIMWVQNLLALPNGHRCGGQVITGR